MTTESKDERFNRILEEARQRSKAWYRAGNTGPMPHQPLPDLSPNATRVEREMRATIVRARGRVERYRAASAGGGAL